MDSWMIIFMISASDAALVLVQVEAAIRIALQTVTTLEASAL